jgi:HPt (histidine-containing phosphotransfer) domain-containing protein
MVDLSFLETFTKGNKEKMKRYINIYLSIAPSTFENMAQNIIDQDWEQLRINAHSLKPQADYMGIPSLKSVLAEIEQNVHENHFDQLSKLFEKASNIHIKSTPYLNAFIDSP